MATNNKEYMKQYQAARRAKSGGFNLTLARTLHQEMIARGVAPDDARWAIIDACGRGCFGYIGQNMR